MAAKRAQTTRSKRSQASSSFQPKASQTKKGRAQTARSQRSQASSSFQPEASQSKKGRTQTAWSQHSQASSSFQPKASRKKGRGKTCLRKLFNRPEDAPKLVLHWNEYGQNVGENAALFTSYLGTLSRDASMAPISESRWKHIPYENKLRMWASIQLFFDIDETHQKYVFKSLGLKWKNWKSTLKEAFYNKYDTDTERIEAVRVDSRVKVDQWKLLIQYWDSPEGKIWTERNKAIRAKQTMLHTCGTKSIARWREEEALKNVDHQPSSRADLWKIVHTRKNGAASDPFAAEKLRIMEAKLKDLPVESSNDITERDKIFQEVMGPERPGRVRGLGMGVTPTQVCGHDHANPASVQELTKLRLENAEVKQENAEMKSQISFLMTQWTQISQLIPTLTQATGLSDI